MLAYLVLLLSIFSTCAQASKAQLLSIEATSQSSSLAFCFDQPVSAKTFSLQKPDRFVIDIPEAILSSDRLKNIKLNHPIVKTIRIGYPNRQNLRVVIETDFNKSSALSWNIAESTVTGTKCFMLKVISDKKSEVVLDKKSIEHREVASSELAQKKSKTTLDEIFNAVDSTSKHSSEESIQKQQLQPMMTVLSRPTVIIALDPGHGGKDPGAIGPRGRTEKSITLAIAKQLQYQINAQPGMKAILTRETDTYIDLRKRLRIARRANADVFISIHADAFINPESRGASVFALSQAGATSEAARWLAEKENYSELGGVNLSELDDESGLVRTVLLDLSQTATISASLKMGTLVLSNLKDVTKLHHAHIEQARFMVLKSPDIPSILIETGFISNPKEERRLENQSYQRLLTTAIMKGVTQYIQQYPSLKLAQPSEKLMKPTEPASKASVELKSLSKVVQHIEPKVSKSTTGELRTGKLSVKQLPSTQLSSRNALSSKPPSERSAASSQHPLSFHTVTLGESLSRIAVKYHVSIEQLKKANPKVANVIKPGQKIIIPVS